VDLIVFILIIAWVVCDKQQLITKLFYLTS